MKANLTSANRINISFSGILKSILTVLIVLAFTNLKAQTQVPASNVLGPLKAYAGGENIVITSEISASGEPVTTYTLENNTSGASIVSKGTLVYNSTTGVTTQSVTVNPGLLKGSFNISLVVNTSSGSCVSSKSVTVVKRR